MITITPSELWLLLGVVLIILELSQLPGIGLFFFSFGAISTSIIIYYWPQENIIIQFGYFGIAVFVQFVLLWYPLKIYVYKNKDSCQRNSFDLIGATVIVINKDIKAKNYGQVLWSGTIMNVQLQDNEGMAKVGEDIYVLDIKGNTLICTKNKS